MLSYKRYKIIVKTFCVYDILALLPMAVPVINSEHIATLSKINILLGGADWGTFLPIHLLFIQMLGILGAGWAIWRWKYISVEIGRYEGYLRILFSVTLFWAYFLTQHPIILIFAVIDLIASILHLIKCECSEPKT
ncbi:MAG: hypothetical protein P8179_13025 [Candidatus Thiodiazotropha sp.]